MTLISNSLAVLVTLLSINAPEHGVVLVGIVISGGGIKIKNTFGQEILLLEYLIRNAGNLS